MLEIYIVLIGKTKGSLRSPLFLFSAFFNQRSGIEGTHLRRNNILSEKLKSGELDAEELASMGDEAGSQFSA